MLGVQFTWTVELGYGTPYLLSLGVPKSMTALVWLAGPLSGLIIQPVVGVFSDSLDWRMGRRRPFILIGAALMIVSMYMVAYARELAQLLVGDHAQQGEFDDAERAAFASEVKGWTIGFAVVGFYCLDFSINAVQASCRSLIMDIPRTNQQEVCNAWSGWMNNLGSVVGFFAGNLDLVKYFSPFLGDSQIKILANLAIIVLVTCLGTCCLSVREVRYIPTEEETNRSAWNTIGDIWKAFRKLPAEIQRICNVQFFAWMGWFPFLFYVTTWFGEILNRTEDHPGTVAERAGSFALLCWAGVAVVCGVLIPKMTPQEFGLERWPRNPFTLKNLWTMSLVWFGTCMGLTWFVEGIWTATMVVAFCGVPWAIAMWVPFAMVGEILSDMKDRLEAYENDPVHRIPSADGANYGSIMRHDQQQGSADLQEQDGQGTSEASDTVRDDDIRSVSDQGLLTISELEAEEARRRQGSHLDAGLVLGVHNMYIVFPQFVDALIASCLFAMIGSIPQNGGPSPPDGHSPNPGQGFVNASYGAVIFGADDPEPVGWVLRFGGLMALVAAYLTRRL
ncbi:hypothetical protein BGZ51_006604 [Haplosporangium sp. Z 767]|nr:hypothetical protein BGZ50_003035 [Haplosporangium sp. Z 11]KAF9191884.1 hypothetical protein BGZ51_006604 [Haplosporangium sp. Z 767]